MQDASQDRRSGSRGPLLAGLLVLLIGVVAVVVAVRWVIDSGGADASIAPAAQGPLDPAASSVAPSSAAASPSAPASVTIAAVGDMACDPSGKADADGDEGGPDACKQDAVGALVAKANPAAFLALGDTQYEDGELSAYRASYAKAFGALLPITYPVTGNHEYHTSDASGYFEYFGSRAGPRGKGWYGFDLGGWHLVGLNANCDQVDCSADGEQVAWLKADLSAHRTTCTLAFWHQPRWSSGAHGDNKDVAPLVSALMDAGADLMLGGHDHDYERFRPQDADGKSDARHGIRQFVVGTGGRSLRHLPGETGTEASDSKDYGALFLTLKPTSYSWQFRTVQGKVADSGSATCHPAP